MPLFFRFDLFLEARAEILEKIRWFFGRFEDTKRTFWNQLTFRCIQGFMSNTTKKTWTVSSHGLYNSYIMHCRYCRFCLPRDEYTIPTTPNIIDKWVNAKVKDGAFTKYVTLLCRSCHFDRASNDEFSVECLFWFFQPTWKSDLKVIQINKNYLFKI